MTTGLAFTRFGGTTLDCEVAIVPGKGKLIITGLLEKGMQESAQAAMSYIRSRQKMLGLDEEFYQSLDFHVHFPEFVPKDGPSAGITMATSIASALLRIPVRRTVAMTGEITLRGRVLPIGGLKEKTLAAHRAGIDTLLIPREPQRPGIPRRVLNSLRVVLVEHMDEVLREALCLSDPDALSVGHGLDRSNTKTVSWLRRRRKPATTGEALRDTTSLPVAPAGYLFAIRGRVVRRWVRRTCVLIWARITRGPFAGGASLG